MDYMDKIKQIRKAHGVSQAEMAEILQTTQTQYYKYEAKKQELPIRRLITICKHFHINANWLLGLEE